MQNDNGSDEANGPTVAKRRIGFATMAPEERKARARIGGLASAKSGKGHRYTPEEASAAGRKGGAKVGADREFMSRIGAKGGQVTKTRAAARRAERAQANDATVALMLADVEGGDGESLSGNVERLQAEQDGLTGQNESGEEV